MAVKIINNLFAARKEPCRVATTANITLSGTQTIDGIAVDVDDRVLCKDQNTASENGIYVVSAATWTRDNDADSFEKRPIGMEVYVREGTANGQQYWTQSTRDVYEGTDAAADVEGPDSSTDEALARFDGTSGKLLQNSGWTLSDVDLLTAGANLDMNGNAIQGTDAIPASGPGRAVLADNFFDAATVDNKFVAGSIGEDALTANEVTGRVMANLASLATTGGIPVLFRFTIPSAGTANYDIAVDHDVRFVWCVGFQVSAGEASDTIQVFNGAQAITDAMAWSDTGTPFNVVTPATIDPTDLTLAGGADTLRVTVTDNDAGGDAAAGEFYVLCIRAT